MTNEQSPRPWHYEVDSLGRAWIRDADGNSVWPNSECDVALIVDDVNEYSPVPKTEMLADAVSANIALVDERDRLRDIVRRLVNQFGNLTSYEDDAAILREARAAIGEGETPNGKGVGR